MSFATTVSIDLVHKQAVDEVLVTDSDRDDDLFWVAGRFPAAHGLYSDRAARDRHDFVGLLEMARQAGILVAHRYLDVPLDFRFVLREVELQLADGFSAMPTTDAGSNVVIAVTLTDRAYRNDVLSAWRCRLTLGMNGSVLADSVLSAVAMPDPAYQQLRARGRSDLPAPPQPARPRQEPWCPEHVGRRTDGNVVITAPRRVANRRVCAEVVADIGHPTFFDHELDHVPGLLLVEAARQLTIACTARCDRIDPRELHLVAVRGEFESFAELDHPLVCDAMIGPLARRSSGARVDGNVRLHHAGRSVGEIATRVATR